MKFTTEQDQGTVVFKLSGELTHSDNVVFKFFFDMAENKEVHSIIVDLHRLGFIDSSGIGMLLILRDSCIRYNKKLTLLNPQGQVKKIFLISRFYEIFSVQKAA